MYGRSQQEIESLVHTFNILDICMEIGPSKCNILAISRGHLIQSDDIVLSSSDLIHYLSPVRAYKYLEIEADSVKHHQMKGM